MRVTLVMLVTLVASGCGLGPFAGEGGGGDNLPSAGIGPYGKLEIDFDTPIDDPFVLVDGQADLLEPAILPREDGGYRIFVERRPAGGPSEIWAAEVPALTELPDVALHRVLAATQDWEGGEVRAPSLAVGPTGELLLAYEAGDPAAIGLAISDDNGESFTTRAAPVIADARAPSLTAVDSSIFLFHERLSSRGIFVATSSDGASFESRPNAVLDVGFDDDFDRAAVERPAAIARRTAANRQRFDLFYQGRTGVVDDGEPEIAIGYAGGFDLGSLVRPPPVGEPVLAPGAPREESPAVLIEATRGIMLYVDRRSARARIGAATSP